MRKYFFIIFFGFSHLIGSGQESSGIIYPGGSFFNASTDTLYYLNADKIQTLLYSNDSLENLRTRLAKYRQLNHLLENQIELYKQTSKLKEKESDYWKQELFMADSLLEKSQIKQQNLKSHLHRSRRNHKYYFLAGGLIGGLLTLIFI